MRKGLRGRPRLAINLRRILEAVRRHGQVVAAARELGCSDAYIHVRLRQMDLTMREVLDAASLVELLDRVERQAEGPGEG